MDIKKIKDIHVSGIHCSPEGNYSSKKCQYMRLMPPARNDEFSMKFICMKYSQFLTVEAAKRLRTDQCIQEYGK